MRRVACAVLVLAAVAGCGGDSTGPSATYPKEGTWTLVSVDGEPLPLLPAGSSERWLVSGRIDVTLPCCSTRYRSDSTAGDPAASTSSRSVTFDVQGGHLVMPDLDSFADPLPVMVSGETMTVDDADGSTWLYQWAGATP